MKILFWRIRWMLHYEGNSESDTIQGGGSHPNENKHEVYNFQNVNGHCYGHLQPNGLVKKTMTFTYALIISYRLKQVWNKKL